MSRAAVRAGLLLVAAHLACASPFSGSRVASTPPSCREHDAFQPAYPTQDPRVWLTMPSYRPQDSPRCEAVKRERRRERAVERGLAEEGRDP